MATIASWTKPRAWKRHRPLLQVGSCTGTFWAACGLSSHFFFLFVSYFLFSSPTPCLSFTEVQLTNKIVRHLKCPVMMIWCTYALRKDSPVYLIIAPLYVSFCAWEHLRPPLLANVNYVIERHHFAWSFRMVTVWNIRSSGLIRLIAESSSPAQALLWEAGYTRLSLRSEKAKGEGKGDKEPWGLSSLL